MVRILDGYKSGDDLLLLGSGRRIERDDVWALRIVAAPVIVLAALSAIFQPVVAAGQILGILALYTVAMYVFSSKTDDAES